MTPDYTTPLNTDLIATITANFASPEPVILQVPLRVAAPGADAAVDAAIIARDLLGNNDLADRFDELSIALTNFVQDPSSQVFRSQSLANLDSIVSLLAVDELLVDFVGPLSVVRDELEQAIAPADIQVAIVNLGTVLEGFGTKVTDFVAHNFALFLTPNALVAQPDVPANLVVTIQNVGVETTTYNLALSGVPSTVASTLDQMQVTLDPGEIANVPASLTQSSTNELLSFDFSVDVMVDGITTEIRQSASGTMRARRELVSVTSVDLVPPFADPGGQVMVSARLLNAVNRQQDAR